MPITVLYTMHAQSGRGDELAALLAEILPDTRAFAGCNDLRVVRNVDVPDEIVLVEEWDARESHEKYVAWRRTLDTGARLRPLLADSATAYHAQLRDVHWG
jgi:Uncharacterized conserved protein